MNKETFIRLAEFLFENQCSYYHCCPERIFEDGELLQCLIANKVEMNWQTTPHEQMLTRGTLKEECETKIFFALFLSECYYTFEYVKP